MPPASASATSSGHERPGHRARARLRAVSAPNSTIAAISANTKTQPVLLEDRVDHEPDRAQLDERAQRPRSDVALEVRRAARARPRPRAPPARASPRAGRRAMTSTGSVSSPRTVAAQLEPQHPVGHARRLVEVMGDQHVRERRARCAGAAASPRPTSRASSSSADVGSSSSSTSGSERQRPRQHHALLLADRQPARRRGPRTTASRPAQLEHRGDVRRRARRAGRRKRCCPRPCPRAAPAAGAPGDTSRRSSSRSHVAHVAAAVADLPRSGSTSRFSRRRSSTSRSRTGPRRSRRPAGMSRAHVRAARPRRPGTGSRRELEQRYCTRRLCGSAIVAAHGTTMQARASSTVLATCASRRSRARRSRSPTTCCCASTGPRSAAPTCIPTTAAWRWRRGSCSATSTSARSRPRATASPSSRRASGRSAPSSSRAASAGSAAAASFRSA